jgi:hypothetical protein
VIRQTLDRGSSQSVGRIFETNRAVVNRVDGNGKVELRSALVEVEAPARDIADIDDARRRVQHIEHHREQRRPIRIA